ncbi:MAG TPA: hypothetical protein EYG92_11555 [Lutibacter sp.]|nr:hypothetical protein [Lutibacter sp.]
MQFKHPEILYALFALLIPIVIHLFQLQRFTKTPFTNVKFLKEIELQTRKSSKLKKWLVLFSRLLIFASIIIAFAQPYFSQNDSSKEWLTTLYLDNSISLSAKGNRGELLKRVVQDIAENLPEKGLFTLICNDKVLPNISQKKIIEELKIIDYTAQTKSIKTVLLQAQDLIDSHKNKHHKLILVSDFQNKYSTYLNLENQLASINTNLNLVQLKPKISYNISIDSVAVKENNIDNMVLEITLNHQGESAKSVSVNALQNEIVLAKNTFKIEPNKNKTISLRIPTKVTNLTLKIDEEDAYIFDNTYQISFPTKKKVNVLVIGKSNSFLEKIYTKNEFNLSQKEVNQISYEVIDKQQLVVLNALDKTPQSLGEKLNTYVENGGSLVIIPNKNISVNELNILFNKLNIGQLSKKHTDSLQVTKIHFSHPLIKNVFDMKVSNFQYPKVNTYFNGKLTRQLAILSYENEHPFISQIKKGKGSIFWVASPLDRNSSNFVKSPLIVPIFYNIGKNSTLHNQLSYRLGSTNKIIVNQKLQQDEIVHITSATTDFIPLQEIQTDKVLLYTDEQPAKAGFYAVEHQNNTIQNLAYNNPKAESNYSFYTLEKLSNTNIQLQNDIKETLTTLSSEQNIQSYFKWFVLLALFFVLIEILLLKYL